jgi:hypothetical protein
MSVAMLVAAAVVAAGCSSGDDGPAPDAGAAGGDLDTTTSTGSAFDGTAPDEVTSPPQEGKGINLPQPAGPVPEGYVQQEYFVGGSATSFTAVDTPDDGEWTVSPSDEAPYRTRVIVRRPADRDDFSGTVLVEWFNVSAIEAAPDWGYLSGAIARDGHAYVGVSAQALGIEGGQTLLDVEVDEEQAAALGEQPVEPGGLIGVDPERYGSLDHPGDAYSFDIFSQVGRLLVSSPDQLIGDLSVEQVIAMGESQSAMFLSTLVNAVHPLDPVFDGFLVHSRGSILPGIDGSLVRNRQGETPAAAAERGVRIRTDLDEPVMMVQAETDLTLLGYVHARQPDTDRVRTWELAGTAHADSETLRAVIGGPRTPTVGSLVGCGSINSGPHKEGVRAALHHLIGWAAGGEPPPVGPLLEVDLDADGGPAIRRDEMGNALGGVRNPLVDVPVATLTGDPPQPTSIDELASSGSGICALFGQTIPFDRATLVELHGSAASYFERFGAASEESVAAGFMLQADADALAADVEPNRQLFD